MDKSQTLWNVLFVLHYNIVRGIINLIMLHPYHTLILTSFTYSYAIWFNLF